MTSEQRRTRATSADELCREAYAASGGPVAGVALVAVGGYGRGELAPHSDLDVVLVHEDDLDQARGHFQEAVLLLSGVGADRAAAQLWFELAGLFESVGEPGAAMDAYRRAAAATGLVATPSRRSAPTRAR